MFGTDIGIDLGTATVLIFEKSRGVVLRAPSVVAIDQDTGDILAVGYEAKSMVGRTPGSIISVRPLRDGVIANYEMTEAMLQHFMRRVTKGSQKFFRNRAMICVPSGATDVERRAVLEAALEVGAREAYLIEEPMAAAIGANLKVEEARGKMIVDIGGGTTDIAILSLGGIVTSSSIKIAGNVFDNDIMKYIKDKYKLLIGDRTAEDIKFTIGTVFPGSLNEKMEVRGRDLVTGLPHTITLTSDEVEEALRESVYTIINTAKGVLEQTPPELSADIVDKGIVVTGGGALLNGFEQLLAHELKVPVFIAESPLTCVVEGTGILLDNVNMINNNSLNY